MKSETLEEFVKSGELSPVDLLYLDRFVDKIDDSVIKKYLKSQKVEDKGDLSGVINNLFLVNSYIEELGNREMDENVKEIQTLLEEGEPLSDLVTHSALILSGGFSKKQYKAVVKKTEKSIIKELRKRQRETIETRIKPFRAFSSLQFYTRLAIFTGLIATTAVTCNYIRYQNNFHLIEYAEQQQLVDNFESVEADLVNIDLEERFNKPKSSEQSPEVDGSLPVKLNEINSMKINIGDQKNKVISKELFDIKRDAYLDFISENEGSISAVRAEYHLANHLRDGQVLYGRSDEWIVLKKESFQKLREQGQIDRSYVKSLYRDVYNHNLQTHGNKFQAVNESLNWLDQVSQGDDDIALAATLSLGNLYAEGRKIDEETFDHTKPLQDIQRALKYYQKVCDNTTNHSQYAEAMHKIILIEDQERIGEEGLPLGILGDLRPYKDVAKYTSDSNVRIEMLLKLGNTYQELKHYERANAYFSYTMEITEVDDHRHVIAEESIKNPGWSVFWDILRPW